MYHCSGMKRIALVLITATATALAADKKILIQHSGRQSWVSSDAALARYRAAAGSASDIIVARTPEEFAREVPNADGIIGGVSKDLYPQAKKLKWVQTISAGVEQYSFWPEFVNSNVTLTNCKVVQGPTIADRAFAMLLALTRGLNYYIPNRAKKEWGGRGEGPKGMTELPGMTAVIIGAGGIGTQIAQRAHGFGMKVIGVDPEPIAVSNYYSQIVPPDRLNEVLPQADVVFVSAPLTPKSEHMIASPQFDAMKTGAYFVAVSRGRLYDKGALVKALDSKKIAGAGLDVTDPEPLPPGDSLWNFENVVITPHVASAAEGSNQRRIGVISENIRRFAKGEPMINVVNKAKGY
ncbi:MAG: D-2-hydroxyacid dehydrogenase [Acidobacteria bacterium]|nr:D-2-hydroxyacid dehydrogenase [Acidobacteriota bacterium]